MKIAHYKGRTSRFNRLVAWWTRGPYSHTEAVLHEYDDGTALCASSSWRDGGVRYKTLQLDPTRWDVVEVPQWDAAHAVAWFDQHRGQRYDLLGLAGFVLRRIGDDRRRWFCSEAVGAAVGLAESWRFDPNAFAALCRAQAAGSRTAYNPKS